MKRLFTIIALLLLSGIPFAPALSQGSSDGILGTWTNAEKDARFIISKQGDLFSGKMVWIKDPLINGKPAVDNKNPDASMRSRPLLGLPLLTGFKYASDNTWTDGKIYDPRNGKMYSCKLTLIDPKHLNVRGYVGFSLLGRTDVWTRVE